MPRPGSTTVHPDRLAGQRGLARRFDRTCTIQQPNATRDALGQPIPAWTAVAGLADLACILASATKAQAEVRTPDQTYVEATHTIQLRGRHTTILEHWRAVMDDDEVHDITLVEHDSAGSATRLHTRVVRT